MLLELYDLIQNVSGDKTASDAEMKNNFSYFLLLYLIVCLWYI